LHQSSAGWLLENNLTVCGERALAGLSPEGPAASVLHQGSNQTVKVSRDAPAVRILPVTPYSTIYRGAIEKHLGIDKKIAVRRTLRLCYSFGDGDAGLVVAGGDLLNEMNNAAAEFWILDPHEIFRE
jgi:hypothetical protein